MKTRVVRLLSGCGLLAGLGVCLLAASTLLISGGSTACWHPATGAPETGLHARAVSTGGQSRCYLLYIPAGIDLSQPRTVVFSLHGFASRPEGQVFLSGWNDLADRFGFVVVYPQGTSFPIRWNAALPLASGGADDIQYLRNVLADLTGLLPVDTRCVFMSGMSNGGGMTHRAACEMADQLAAVGDVAGPIVDPPSGCNPSRPVPVVAFYGTDDPLVHYQGGSLHALARRDQAAEDQAVYPGAEGWAAGWAARNGCAPEPQRNEQAEDVTVTRYAGCRDQADVVLYTIHAGGHTWPGGPDLPFLGGTTQSLSASEGMLEFFLAHPLPSAE